MYQEIAIIEEEDSLFNILIKIFGKEKDFIFNNIKPEELEEKIKAIPDLIIIDEDSIKEHSAINVVDYIRNNTDNSITPIIVISSNFDKEHRIDILKNDVEYFIKSPIDEQYLYYTIKNIIRLMSSNRKVSPLTGLPGNVQIQVELKKSSSILDFSEQISQNLSDLGRLICL